MKKINEGIATIAVCLLGGFCMWLTGGGPQELVGLY